MFFQSLCNNPAIFHLAHETLHLCDMFSCNFIDSAENKVLDLCDRMLRACCLYIFHIPFILLISEWVSRHCPGASYSILNSVLLFFFLEATNYRMIQTNVIRRFFEICGCYATDWEGTRKFPRTKLDELRIPISFSAANFFSLWNHLLIINFSWLRQHLKSTPRLQSS